MPILVLLPILSSLYVKNIIASKCLNKRNQGLTHNLAKIVDTEFDYMGEMGTRAHRKYRGKGDKAKLRQMRVWGYGDKVGK